MRQPHAAAGVPAAPGARDRRGWAAAVVLALLVLAVYGQVGGHGFMNIDDDSYVTANPVVLRGLSLDGVSWAFSTFHVSNWHPLTWLSHMLDVTLFGPSAGWHHRVNALYHLANTELLFVVLWRMTGGLWQSAFAAALFGVHPLHVESVAWVAERKDVLSTLFWILTMGAYLRYVRRPGAMRYLAVAASFALGLLSKPMLVTLPFALLLLDWWPLGRLSADAWPRLALEKVPLLLMSAISCAVTYLAQAGGGSAVRLEVIPLGSRISNALVSYAVYLGKTAWPSSLAPHQLHPAVVHAGVPAWQVAGAVLLLGAVSAAALWQARRRPFLAAGWLWYLGTLVPVIGLVQVGLQAHADRYTYVPLIGVFVAAAWGVPSIFPERRFRGPALAALAGVSLLALSAAARVQAGYWRDSVTILSRTVAIADGNWYALNNLGTACDALGQHERAIGCYREALRIRPDFAEAWNNLGVAYGRLGRYQESIGYFAEALRARPAYAQAWYNLGVSCSNLDRCREAVGYLGEAVRFAPGYAEAWNKLGVCHYRLGEREQAVRSFREALRIRPGYPEAAANLAAADGVPGRPTP